MARILVTNDDGIYSEGLRKLADACLRIDGVEVIIVAPDREQSAASHALTLNRPLRMLQARGERVHRRRHAGRLREPRRAQADARRPSRPRRLRHQLRPEPRRRRHLLRHDLRRVRRRAARHPVDRVLHARRRGLLVRSLRRVRGEADPHGRSSSIAIRTSSSTSTSRSTFTGVRVARLGKRIYSERLIERQRSARPDVLLDRRRQADVASRRGHRLRGGARTAASPSRRCTSTSPITNRSRGSNRSRSSLATHAKG